MIQKIKHGYSWLFLSRHTFINLKQILKQFITAFHAHRLRATILTRPIKPYGAEQIFFVTAPPDHIRCYTINLFIGHQKSTLFPPKTAKEFLLSRSINAPSQNTPDSPDRSTPHE